jgi:hypothetical protein
MNTIKHALLSTVLTIATGAAFAQSEPGPAEQLRQSAEMNRPLNLGTSAMARKIATPAPLSAEERKAEETRTNAEMMRPLTFGTVAAGRASGTLRLNEADRKVAESMRSSEQMKPN